MLNKLNNILTLISLLIFIVLLRVENSSFANEASRIAFQLCGLSLFVFGSIYLANKYLASDKHEEINEEFKKGIRDVNNRIIRLNIMSIPAYLTIGLGIYIMFGTAANILVPITLLSIGALIETAILVNLIPLFKERANLIEQSVADHD